MRPISTNILTKTGTLKNTFCGFFKEVSLRCIKRAMFSFFWTDRFNSNGRRNFNHFTTENSCAIYW